MLIKIFSIIINIIYIVILNTELYTDKALMPTEEYREWHRSPVDRLNIAGLPFLLYLQTALACVSIITSILLLFGVQSSNLRKIQLITTIGSTVMFIIIMLVTSNTYAKYS